MESFAAELLFEEARSKGELWKYLGGCPGYALTNLNADLPTDAGGAITPIQQRAGSVPGLKAEFMAAPPRFSGPGLILGPRSPCAGDRAKEKVSPCRSR